MLLGILTALTAASAPACQPVVGAEALWRKDTRWVIVGEIHGTTEMPRAFANLACLAAKSGRPVTIALEFSADWQPVIDSYMQSKGDAAATAALLALPVWKAEFQDGRGSQAFLSLFENLRRLHSAGMIKRVVATDKKAAPLAAGQTRDDAMANNWKNVVAPADGLILALVGNIHAMRRPLDRPGGAIYPAASLLDASKTVTVNVRSNGGTAWNCQVDGCATHPSGPDRQAAPGIAFSTDPSVPWHAVYELGTITTASAPAVVPPVGQPKPKPPLPPGPRTGCPGPS